MEGLCKGQCGDGTDDDVTAAFTEAALAIGLSRAEIGRTLASARAAGLANPRCVPTVGQEAAP